MNARSSAPVGVFDSGIGGVSVLAALRHELPFESFIYVADTGHLPYGEKSRAAIVARAFRIADYFLEQGAKAIAIPCNTATAAAVAELRARHPGLPIIGIEPAVKPAARLTRSGVIAVLATTGTLTSEKFRELVRREALGVEVLVKPCPGWVTLVEAGGWPPEADAVIAEPIKDLLRRGADVLVLGCTHFPFLIERIRRLVGPDMPVLETGEPFARQLRRQLAEHGLLATQTDASTRYFTSGHPAAVARQIAVLTGTEPEVRRLPATYC
jgi:glutamate racemase